jgi:hypothetical protein
LGNLANSAPKPRFWRQSASKFNRLQPNSLRTKQGIFLAKQGIDFKEQGISSGRELSGKIANFRLLADLLPPLLVANPFSAMRASLRRWSSDEFEDGVAHGWQGRLGRWPVDSFFPALQLQGGDAGGRRTRSSS